MVKKELGPYIRETLITRYGTLAVAAEHLGFSYERVKKAIQRNRFSAADLEMLLPDRNHEDLSKEFHFNLARRHSGEPVDPGSERFDLFSSLETGFRSFQRGVRETDFGEFINDLYNKIGAEQSVQSMVLFCHDSSRPVEWNPEEVRLLFQLHHAIRNGAMIIYLMECDLENTVNPKPLREDNVDRHFKRVVGRLKRLSQDDPPDPGTPTGFVALLRVPRCAFCIPYQKPALFSRYKGDGNAEPPLHYALTTTEIPERIDGAECLGTAVIPLTNVIAHAMRDYLFELREYITEASKDGADEAKFRGSSFPESDNIAEEVIRRLKPLLELGYVRPAS